MNTYMSYTNYAEMFLTKDEKNGPWKLINSLGGTLYPEASEFIEHHHYDIGDYILYEAFLIDKMIAQITSIKCSARVTKDSFTDNEEIELTFAYCTDAGHSVHEDSILALIHF